MFANTHTKAEDETEQPMLLDQQNIEGIQANSSLSNDGVGFDQSLIEASSAIKVSESQVAVSSEYKKQNDGTATGDGINNDDISDEILEIASKRLKQEKTQSPIQTEKVIESKTICYCSNFDLNINEWFNEFENIEIFKLNMKKNLGIPLFHLMLTLLCIGTMWLQYFNEALQRAEPVTLKGRA